MKKQLLILTALVGLSAMLFSCSDDKVTKPEETDDVTYFNNNVYSYTYDEYDLDENNVQNAETVHQDSLVLTQTLTKDGKNASEFQVYTNVEGTYTEDGMVYYAGETNKLYAHLSVFQSLLGNIESNGFSLAPLFDQAGDWFLIADAKANSSWILFDGVVNFDLPIVGATDGDVKISMVNGGKTNFTIDGKTTSVDKFDMTVNIKASTIAGDVATTVKGTFWVAPNIGVVKSNISSFAVPEAFLSIEGTESVLVNYTPQTAIEM